MCGRDGLGRVAQDVEGTKMSAEKPTVKAEHQEGYALYCIMNSVSEDVEGWHYNDNKDSWQRKAKEFLGIAEDQNFTSE